MKNKIYATNIALLPESSISDDITKPLKDEDHFMDGIQFHITLGKTNIREEFISSNLPKNITFDRFALWQMGNSKSIKKIISEIK